MRVQSSAYLNITVYSLALSGSYNWSLFFYWELVDGVFVWEDADALDPTAEFEATTHLEFSLNLIFLGRNWAIIIFFSVDIDTYNYI